jgi:hypothetical protein
MDDNNATLSHNQQKQPILPLKMPLTFFSPVGKGTVTVLEQNPMAEAK